MTRRTAAGKASQGSENTKQVPGARRKAPLFRVTPLAGILLAAFALLALAVASDAPFIEWINTSVLTWVRAIRTPGLTTFFEGITHLGDALVIIGISLVAIVVLFVRRRFANGLFVFLSVGAAAAFSQLFKLLLSNSRPLEVYRLVVERGFSFPSGHSICTLALYGALGLLIASRIPSRAGKVACGVVFGVLIVCVSVSRIYLGVHWVADVAGSWLLGGAILATMYDAWKQGRFDVAVPGSGG